MRCRCPPERQLPKCPGRSFVPVGQVVFDETVRVGPLGGLDHLLGRGAGVAVADVVEDRVVEEHGFLGHQTDLPAEVTGSHVRQGHAVQLDHAAGGIGEARDQVGQRTLAAAVRANDGHRFAEDNLQVHLGKHRFARLVGKADVLEHEITAVGVKRDGMFRVADLRLAIESGRRSGRRPRWQPGDG